MKRSCDPRGTTWATEPSQKWLRNTESNRSSCPRPPKKPCVLASSSMSHLSAARAPPMVGRLIEAAVPRGPVRWMARVPASASSTAAVLIVRRMATSSSLVMRLREERRVSEGAMRPPPPPPPSNRQHSWGTGGLTCCSHDTQGACRAPSALPPIHPGAREAQTATRRSRGDGGDGAAAGPSAGFAGGL
ncbi:hypothetical protein DMC30DRAFT_224118 [Rhodotorula diobovata]|uniref:Uncharacterized protein n=1 Tax=Rhodotorula diobovata TaxID=5288 RepID=A0A5C5FXI4_9BASI|nr:hypothetical protein DMC30DRAFT_224118 [Rhodotorula diobovata]